jgi:MFS family permease
MSLFPTTKSDPELAPFRAGLLFGFFNALTWQIGIGTPMVLFAEQLGATSFQVGLAYSFVFLLTPIQVAATALLPRYGFKRLSLGGWSARSVFLAVPVVLAALAPEVGQPWMINTLIWSVFFFCFFRSIGAAAMTTWFIGFLPPNIRGRYFATDQILSGIAGVGTLIACAALFALLPIYTALLMQYLLALAGSTLSYYSLKRLPDIPKPSSISLRSVIRDTPRHLFRPSPFRHYLWLAVWYTVITTPIPPFAAYYLKVAAQLSPGTIMVFEVMRYSGAILGAWLLRRRIDETGARPFFLVSLVLTAIAAVGWWLYLRHVIDGRFAMFAIYFIVGLGWVCWTVANLNYLPKVAPVEERALFVSLHGAATFFLGGCAPILWGLVLKSTGADGAPMINAVIFQVFFATVLASACCLSILVARLPEESKVSVEPIIITNAIMNPFRAASYLASLIDLQSLRPGGSAASDQTKSSRSSDP